MLRARQPVLSIADAFWHWDVGRRLVADGLVRADPYSFLTDGDWVPNQWGTELVIGVADVIGGLPAVALLAVLLVAASHAVVGLALWRREPTLLTLAILGLAVGSTWNNLGLRGNLFTFVLLPLLLLELLRSDGPRPAVVLALMALWANVHAAFLLGAGLIVLHSVATVLTGHASLRRGAAVIAAGGVGTLLTPYGPRLVTQAVDLTLNAGGTDLVEWASTSLTAPGALPFTALVVLVLGVLVTSAHGRPVEALLVLALVFVGLTSVRNVAPAALGIATVAVGPAHRALRPTGSPEPHGQLRLLDRVAAGALGIAAVVLVLAIIPWSRALDQHVGAVPLETIRALDAADDEHRVHAASSWTAAVGVLTGEDVRTSVDGRLELFSQEELARGRRVDLAQHGWEEVVAAWCTTDVIAPATSRLADALADSASWQFRQEADVHGSSATAVWYEAAHPPPGCSAG